MKFILTLITAFSFLIISCNDSDDVNQRFLDTYREILIARETIADSVEANKRVMEIMDEHGYTQAEFQEEFFEIASDNEEMVRTIDSLRNYLKSKADSIRNPKASEEAEPGAPGEPATPSQNVKPAVPGE